MFVVDMVVAPDLVFVVKDDLDFGVVFQTKDLNEACRVCQDFNGKKTSANKDFQRKKKALTQKTAKTSTQKSLRTKLLASIHCDENYKQINEAGAWEDWLMLRFGVKSCKALNEAELGNVLDIFSAKCQDRDFVLRRGTATRAQVKKICAIMRQRKFSQRAKEAFVKKQIGAFKPFYLLDKDEASKIITGLQKINGER